MTHYMSQEPHFPSGQLALGGFHLQPRRYESAQDLPQSFQVLVEPVREHDYIVQIDQTCLPLKPPHDDFHNSLKGPRCIA